VDPGPAALLLGRRVGVHRPRSLLSRPGERGSLQRCLQRLFGGVGRDNGGSRRQAQRAPRGTRQTQRAGTHRRARQRRERRRSKLSVDLRL
jgi:hypothetical protein